MRRSLPLALLAISSAAASVTVAHADSIGLHQSPEEVESWYVALGDSYTSGPLLSRPVGRAPMAASTAEESRVNGPIDCGKSDQNYPHLVAEYLGLFDPAHPEGTFHHQDHHPGFIDISCGSARTRHLWMEQGAAFDFPNRPQLSVLTDGDLGVDADRVELVSLGIGGNDFGFGAIQDECVEKPLASTLDPTVDDYRCSTDFFEVVEANGKTVLQNKLDKVAHRLRISLLGTHIPTVDADGNPAVEILVHDDVDLARVPEPLKTDDGNGLRGLLELAPNADVLLFGYPALMPHDHDGEANETVNGCFPYIPVFPEDAAAISVVNRELNRIVEEAAALDERIHYVDWYAPSSVDPLTGVSHDMCAPPGVAWTNGVVLAPPSFPIHPNALGTRGAAEAGIRRIEGNPYRYDEATDTWSFQPAAPIVLDGFPMNPAWVTSPTTEDLPTS